MADIHRLIHQVIHLDIVYASCDNAATHKPRNCHPGDARVVDITSIFITTVIASRSYIHGCNFSFSASVSCIIHAAQNSIADKIIIHVYTANTSDFGTIFTNTESNYTSAYLKYKRYTFYQAKDYCITSFKVQFY